MSIGRDAWSIHRKTRALTTRALHGRSHASASRSISRRRRAMSPDTDSRLWRRGSGIRFAPRPDPVPLYPSLDVKRFVHEASVQAEVPAEEPEVQQQQQQQQPPEDEPSNAAPSQRTDPPSTSLAYKINVESFRRARASAVGSPQSFWSHTMYSRVSEDGTRSNVKVHYCTSKHTMEFVCQKYFAGEPVLGFDLEWSPRATKAMDARQNVSLIQIASPGRIGLFHCAMFAKDDFVAPSFRKMMGDPNVTKVGVAIKADCTRLANYLGVESRGIFELSHLYKLVKYTRERRPGLINKSLVTLAAQVQEFLGLPLYKGDSVRSSDWTRYLAAQQISYSASDAYAGIQLYYTLDEERRKLSPTPPLPYHAELNRPLPIPDLGPDVEPLPPPNPAAVDDAGPKFRDGRIATAHGKMEKYRASKRGPVSVGPSALRAYYIWYGNQDLDPAAIASLLRDPPLQTHTVVSYILSAVTEEHMPYSRTRVRDELLARLKPEAMKAAKYQALKEACEAEAAAGAQS